MAPKPEPMDADEIEGAIQQWVNDATNYMASELSPVRVKQTEYYRGEKFGNEEAGRSQFICTDLRDVTLAVMPSLIRLFLPTSGHVIEYHARPKTPDQISQAVAMADQATEFINAVVVDQDNDGFLEIHAAFKDALIRDNGFIKWWWDDQSVYQDYTARLDVLQYEALLQDPDVEVKKTTTIPGEPPYYEVSYKHWRREGVARFMCTPPEEVLTSRDARSRVEASFFAHQTEKTRSELLSMGVPERDINEFGGPSTEVRQNIEETARRGGISHIDQAPDPTLVKHLWIESYPYLDVDGDGIAELVKVTTIGPGCHLVGEPEPIDERPFAIFCPDPEPHVLLGRGLGPRVMDLQLMKSSVIRAQADGTSQALFPDTFYMEGAVSREEMDSTAMGKRIPVRDGLQPSQAVWEVPHVFDYTGAQALLQYLDAVKQQRIGPLPATLDPDSLQSTPEIGVKATVQAASEQVELIARVFAATGMKQLGKGLLKLLVEHQPKARIARLRGQFVQVDPKAWDADMDVSVHVALGTQDKLGVLAANAMKQEQALQLLGPSNPALTVGQLLHSYKTMLELQGIPDTTKFWNDLPLNWQPPPAPETPDPNQLIAQAEMAKAQSQIAKQQAEIAEARVKLLQEEANLHSEYEEKIATLALQREEMHLTDERERDKMEADIALRVAEINAKYNTQLTIEQLNADIAREQMETDATTARETAALKVEKPKKKTMKLSREGKQVTVQIEEGSNGVGG